VALPTPASAERAAILLQELEHRRLECKKTIISETALKCDGYDAADLVGKFEMNCNLWG
jgi:hypothetical protein